MFKKLTKAKVQKATYKHSDAVRNAPPLAPPSPAGVCKHGAIFGSNCTSCDAEYLGVNLKNLQKEHAKWLKTNFPNAGYFDCLLKLHEEVGELNAAIYRNRFDKESHMKQIKDAIGDIVIALSGVATYLGVHYSDAVINAWEEVKTRDYRNK